MATTMQAQPPRRHPLLYRAWPPGAWQAGPAAQAVSRGLADWRAAIRRDLSDLTGEDVAGSPFASQACRVPARGFHVFAVAPA